MYKLVYQYIWQMSDYVGIWEIDIPTLREDIGFSEKEFDFQDFLYEVNSDVDKYNGNRKERERLYLFDNNKRLIITGYLQFAYPSKDGKLTKRNAVVYTALNRLRGHGLLKKMLHEGYIIMEEMLPEHEDLENKREEIRAKRRIKADTELIDPLEGAENEPIPDAYSEEFLAGPEFNVQKAEWIFNDRPGLAKKRVENIRNELMNSYTMRAGIQRAAGIGDDELDNLITDFTNSILATGHFTMSYREVRKYCVNKINYIKRNGYGRKRKGSDAEIDALRQYIEG